MHPYLAKHLLVAIGDVVDGWQADDFSFVIGIHVVDDVLEPKGAAWLPPVGGQVGKLGLAQLDCLHFVHLGDCARVLGGVVHLGGHVLVVGGLSHCVRCFLWHGCECGGVSQELHQQREGGRERVPVTISVQGRPRAQHAESRLRSREWAAHPRGAVEDEGVIW